MNPVNLEDLLKETEVNLSTKVNDKWTAVFKVGLNKFGNVSASVNWDALEKSRQAGSDWSNFSVFFNKPKGGAQQAAQPQTSSAVAELDDEVPF